MGDIVRVGEIVPNFEMENFDSQEGGSRNHFPGIAAQGEEVVQFARIHGHHQLGGGRVGEHEASREKLDELLAAIMARRDSLAAKAGTMKPLAVKIAPDLDDAQVEAIAELAVKHRIDALIATNTTIGRAGVEGHRHAQEAGGLSGRPVFALSTEVLRKLSRLLAGRIPLIGVGGIHSGSDAKAKTDAGASFVQVYTGFIYHGPDLVAEARRALKA